MSEEDREEYRQLQNKLKCARWRAKKRVIVKEKVHLEKRPIFKTKIVWASNYNRHLSYLILSHIIFWDDLNCEFFKSFSMFAFFN